MATVLVLEYDSMSAVTGLPIWPPAKQTPVSVPGSVTIRSNTKIVALSADANCRMGIGVDAEAYSTPIIAAADANLYERGTGSTTVLNFIAEA